MFGIRMHRDDEIGRTGRKIGECAAVYGLPGKFVAFTRASGSVAGPGPREARP